jgi:hypothetical protein
MIPVSGDLSPFRCSIETRQVEEAFQWDDDDMQTPLSANPPPADSAEIVTTAAETSIAHEPTQTKADEPEEGKLDAAISEPTVIPDIVEEQAAPAKEAEEEAKESVLENIEPTEVVAEQEDATINEPQAAQEPDVEPTPVQETPVSETKQPMSAKVLFLSWIGCDFMATSDCFAPAPGPRRGRSLWMGIES